MSSPFRSFRSTDSNTDALARARAAAFAAHRATALRHHCRLAAETVHPRFAFLVDVASVLLTVNSGYE